MKLFNSLLKLTEDVLDVATTPLRIAADATRVVIAPIKKMTNIVADEAEKIADDLEKDLK